MAVETVKRPSYKTTPIAKRLRLRDNDDDFSNYSWNSVHNAIEREKPRIIADIGLSGNPVDMRMLEALEKNLLANREGWGRRNYAHDWRRDDKVEWTNTEYRGFGEPQRLAVGGTARGGGVDARWGQPDWGRWGVGFRVAVVFGS